MTCCQQNVYNYFVLMIVFKSVLKGDSNLCPGAHLFSWALFTPLLPEVFE